MSVSVFIVGGGVTRWPWPGWPELTSGRWRQVGGGLLSVSAGRTWILCWWDLNVTSWSHQAPDRRLDQAANRHHPHRTTHKDNQTEKTWGPLGSHWIKITWRLALTAREISRDHQTWLQTWSPNNYRQLIEPKQWVTLGIILVSTGGRLGRHSMTSCSTSPPTDRI